ncbi:hypothetical protein [Catenulispora subtropica]|uniref:ABC3 transporter permease protein domain-containing protein n=1 Tax=Catenulispora subtropica TaxID=450798 RepID=A0ABP5EIQ8_9ACTN
MSARWRAELRAGRSALALVALLAAATAGAAAAVPAETDASDAATVSTITGRALHTQRDLVLTAKSGLPDQTFTVEDGAALREIAATSRGSLPAVVGGLVTATRITVAKEMSLQVTDPPATVRLPVQARPVSVVGYESAVSFVEGAPPGPPAWMKSTAPGPTGSPQPGSSQPGSPGPGWSVPVALSRSVADVLGLHTGAKVHAPVAGAGGSARASSASTLELVVSGVFDTGAPTDDQMWAFTPNLLRPLKTRACNPPAVDCKALSDVWMADVLVDDPSTVDLVAQFTGDPVVVTMEHIVDRARLARAGLPAVAAGLRDAQRFGKGATPADPSGVPYPMELSTGLPKLIAAAEEDQRAGHALDAVVLGGTVAGGLAAFLLMLRMTVTRRSAEIALCKARGAASWRLAVRFAVQTGAVVLGFGAVGVGIALALGPTPRNAAEAWYGAVLETLVSVAIVLVLVGRHTDRLPSQRHERLGGEARARRAVRDGGLVAGAVGALAFLRSQGVDAAAGSIDWIAVAAPALLAVSAGVATVRLVPALLAGPAFAARAGRAAAGFVATVLAARRVRAVAAPLTGLAVVVAAGMFAAGYDAAVPQRVRIDAVHTVGAAARVTAQQAVPDPEAPAPAFDPGFVDAARKVPGVTAVAAAWVGPGTIDPGGDPGGRRAALIVVDPRSFRALAAATREAFDVPMGTVPDLWPRTIGDDRAAPVLVSPDLASLVGTDGSVGPPGQTVKADYVAAVDLPAAESVTAENGQSYVIVAADQLPGAAVTPLTTFGEPNTAWIAGTPSRRDLQAALAPYSPAGLLVDRFADAEKTGLGDARVAAARTVFHLVELLCGAYFALCLLLLLASSRGASRDSALLLQVFGLRGGAARAISFLVTLPLALLAAVVGIGAGVALAPIIGPLTRGGAAVVGTAPTGMRWAVIDGVVVVGAVVAGTVADVLMRRSAEMTVRLRAAEFE